MSALIKAGTAATLARALGRNDARSAPIADTTLIDLRNELEATRAELAEMREEMAIALREARASGEAAGRASATRDADHGLEILEKAVAQAHERFEDRLVGLETLAAMIARAALMRIVKDEGRFAELVTAQIALRVTALREESMVSVRVSTDDFADDDALAALVEETQAGTVEIFADPALGSGECRIDLRLGHIDLGVQAQWQGLDALLDSLIEAEA